MIVCLSVLIVLFRQRTCHKTCRDGGRLLSQPTFEQYNFLTLKPKERINSLVVQAVEFRLWTTSQDLFLALLKPVSTKERTNSLVAEAGESRLSTTSTVFFAIFIPSEAKERTNFLVAQSELSTKSTFYFIT